MGRYWDYRKRGICPDCCRRKGQPVRCKKCAKRKREAIARDHREKLAKGRCRCGATPKKPGLRHCVGCLELRAAANKRWRAKRRAKLVIGKG